MGSALSFIETVAGFRYSVNVKLDLENNEKINSYIITAGSVRLFEEFFSSFDFDTGNRAHLLIGSYGTGKSFFATVLASLLQSNNEERHSNLLEMITRYNKSLVKKVREKLSEKYLIVLPTIEQGNFKQAMLFSLKRALDNLGIEDLFPDTYFSAVLKKIQQWEKEYKTTYNQLKRDLKEKSGMNIFEFEEKIKNFEKSSYELFLRIYPSLTAGGDFNPFYDCNLIDVYMDVVRKLKGHQYKGVFVIFDEFNRLLEEDIDYFNSDILQSFAEAASASGENEIHLLLISHRGLLQYAHNMSQEKIKEWRKIEGRFRSYNLADYSTQSYDLIASVIKKREDGWSKFKNEYLHELKHMEEKTIAFKLFPELETEDIQKTIVEGCYPLHPLATYCLPIISQKVAQNERTMFTYLSTEELYSLDYYLERVYFKYDVPFIGLECLYDYFTDLMQKDFEYTQTYKAWSDSQRALSKLAQKEGIAVDIIKTLGLIYAINIFSSLPPSQEVLLFSLSKYKEQDVVTTLDTLIRKKIIIYRKSLQQFKFFEGSDIQLYKHIETKKEEKKGNFSSQLILEEYFSPTPKLPHRYNNSKKMIRYFVVEYMALDEIKLVDFNALLEKRDYLDGVIIYVLVESKKEINNFERMVNNFKHSQVVFALPNEPMHLYSYLRDLDALLSLRRDQKFIAQDSIIEEELGVHIEDLKLLIGSRLERLFRPENGNISFYNKGVCIDTIRSERDLSNCLTEICDDIFSSTPVINNELLIKNTLTPVQKKASSFVVKKLINNELELNLGIKGYGPDFLIFRSVFLNTRLFIEDKKRLVAGHNISLQLNEVFDEIGEFYNRANVEEVSFEMIYRNLRSKPFGLRRGVIPLLLVYYFHKHNLFKEMVVKHNGSEVPIDEKIFERINKFPSRYTLEIVKLDNVTRDYLDSIRCHIKDYMKQYRYEVNLYHESLEGIKKWYQSLHVYSRDTEKISTSSFILRRLLLKSSTDAKKILLDAVPKKILGSDLTSSNVSAMKEKIVLFFSEHERAFSELIICVKEELLILFNKKQGRIGEILEEWYSSLDNKVVNHSHSLVVNEFISFAQKIDLYGNDENSIIEHLSLLITGLNVSDWSDKTKEIFLEKIKSIIEEISGYKDGEGLKRDYCVSITNNNDTTIEKTLTSVEIKGTASILEKRIKSTLRDIGPAVDEQEKQQILINILMDLLE